jgi:hypothetical protein
VARSPLSAVTLISIVILAQFPKKSHTDKKAIHKFVNLNNLCAAVLGNNAKSKRLILNFAWV